MMLDEHLGQQMEAIFLDDLRTLHGRTPCAPTGGINKPAPPQGGID